MTDFAYLKQCYGLSQIIATNLCSVSPTPALPTTTLADIIPLLKNVPGPARASAFFTIQVIYTPITQSFESDLHDIAVQNHRGKHLLRTAPITSLMILQMHALKSNLKPAKALKARALIAKTLRVNHTRYVHAYPTFRIPCSTIENSEIRELIYYMVCSVNHDEELQHLLLSNTRIISTAHKSIATPLHNHIGFAKADPAVTPTACTCARHTDDLPRNLN
jgi:hypothetical protein